MSYKTFATLALATGFAAAKPITPGFTPRNVAINNGFNGQGFNFIDGFNNFNNQQQVIQIQEQNLQIVDNGFQQQVVQQVQDVLIVDQQNNGFNNDLNNLFRKANFKNNFNDVSTVMLVVQEIQVAVDNGFGGQFQQNIFAQSALVANRGAFQTNTVMVFDSRTLIAQDILGANFNGIQNIVGGNVGNGAFPTKTAGVQLFGAKPTWSSVADDPAATLGGIWQGELEDLQKSDNDQADNDLNNQIAGQEQLEGQENKDENKDENAEQDQNAEEQQNAEEEQQNAEAEASASGNATAEATAKAKF